VQRFNIEHSRHVPDAVAGGPRAANLGGFSLNALRSVGLEMFVPFIAGHLLQPWIGSWVQQRRYGSPVERMYLWRHWQLNSVESIFLAVLS